MQRREGEPMALGEWELRSEPDGIYVRNPEGEVKLLVSDEDLARTHNPQALITERFSWERRNYERLHVGGAQANAWADAELFHAVEWLGRQFLHPAGREEARRLIEWRAW